MKQIFLFTDIEGSTNLWEQDSEKMSRALALHDKILSDIIPEYGGKIMKHTGDGVFAAFSSATEALSCAVKLQKAFSRKGEYEQCNDFRVRMGLHYGFAEKRDNDLFGPAVNLTQRVMDAGNGGQILVTEEIAELCKLEGDITFRDLGIQRLRNLSTPRKLFLLLHPDIPDRPAASPRTLSSIPNNLQRPMTPFIGREEELHRICTMLKKSNCRMLTLHGSGGTGKTRLALQAAAMEIVEFTDGVFFISLAKIRSPDLIISAVAEVLGLDLGNTQNPGNSIIDYLSDLKVLFVLDNYEHLASSTGFPRRLIAETNRVKLLITSREQLRLSAENVLEIRGMSIPEENTSQLSDSERLYYETAERVSGRQMMAESSEKVAEICKHLSGSPLAIVLAASWDGILSPSEILDEIRNSHSLSSNLADLPERHSSLKAVFMFSWNILSTEEKNMFCRLTVFRGHFTRAAAEKVCSLELKDLTSLVNKSLAERHEDGTFGIHELIHSFAGEKSEEVFSRYESDLLAGRHSSFFLSLLREHTDNLLAGNRSSAFQELSGSLEDILAAWHQAFKNSNFELLESCCHGLRVLLALMGMYGKGEALFAQGAEFCESNPGDSASLLRAWLVSYQGWFSSYSNRAEASIRQLKNSVILFKELDEPVGLSSALNMLGNVYYVSGEYDPAAKAYNESLSIRRTLSDKTGISAVLNNLGNLACQRMDYTDAEKFYQESLEKDRALGNQHGVSASLSNLAIIAINMDQLEKAENCLSTALEIEKSIGDRFNVAIVQGIFCRILLKRKEFDSAEAICNENLEMYRNVGNSWGTANTYCTLGIVETLRSNHTKSAEYLVKALDTVEGKDWTPMSLEILGAVAGLLQEEGLFKEAYSMALFVKEHQSSQAELRKEMKFLIASSKKQTSSKIMAGNIKLEDAVRTAKKQLKKMASNSS
ncbi:MAG: tetratricopeptide repeat protein [Candidatus Sabulitectum sp.]|nr:tetratricopeptide repeat protein [Candidatus Sabulitectum sp.]